jgi:hypothetical protein
MMAGNGTGKMLVSCAAALACSTAAGAEPADRAQDRADSRRDFRATAFQIAPSASSRSPSQLATQPASLRSLMFLSKRAGAPTPEPPPSAEEEHEIKPTFTIAVPLTFNSNPEHATSHKDGDGHADPSLDLTIEIPFKGMLLTLEGTADMDLNFDRPSNDSTTLEGVTNLDFKQFGSVVPYLNYTVDDLYSSQFGDHSGTTHTFSLGANYSRDFPKADPKETTPDPNKPAPVTLALNLEVGRREASDDDAEQYRGRLKVGLSGAFSPKLGWSLKGGVTYKDYTAGANDGRKDVAIQGTAALNFPLSDKLTLSVAAQIERNESDMAGKDYTAWDVGPTLKRTF